METSEDVKRETLHHINSIPTERSHQRSTKNGMDKFRSWTVDTTMAESTATLPRSYKE